MNFIEKMFETVAPFFADDKSQAMFWLAAIAIVALLSGIPPESPLVVAIVGGIAGMAQGRGGAK